MWGERPTITSEAARPPTNPSVAPNGAPRIILRPLSQGGGRDGLTLGYYLASPTGTLATVGFSLATCLQGVVIVALFDLGGGLPPTCLSCANAHSE